MAGENKECKTSGGLKMIARALVGLALIAAGLYLGWNWRGSLIILIKGCLGPLIILVGLVFIAIAKE
ncbi:MAG: hypothetical protein PHS93_01195 [Candidatus Omnitrophica bacterium]|nr:hypothetical protein [Candidatus Omnitrophota bacterium]MDD5351768.1 hypothetical protein [Candidatus Omnitrophota bacterium]MDD5550594.1 hypothetical protein [Candidatus Omnitrophota bacterium]